MVYFVATPIVNLGDISLRALEVLRAVDAVFCEDTRHSLKLLNHYQIKKPLVACHKFNERAAAEKLVSLAREGKEVAVVTDAGTPVISDPGNLLAFPAETFAFLGFLRGKTSEKRAFLQKYASFEGTLALYSAPQDVDADVALLYEVWGERQACAVREITKLHESTEYFALSAGLAGEKRGEYVLVVQGVSPQQNPLKSLSEEEHVAHYMAQGMPRKEALKAAAKDRGVSKSELYRRTLPKN